jgi:hypothetical protein
MGGLPVDLEVAAVIFRDWPPLFAATGHMQNGGGKESGAF